ncbi:hypothetical protein AVEN_253129-1 [Araneus ventricosus]|uniref:Uncharacterized protein n=1 Tax=Araneus ventricosus TaxID=182803 RepID=A0A4Y2HED8_ARAVE|nr:hypothetical protein AVEN_253129-1 [Araneus ventricosus]
MRYVDALSRNDVCMISRSQSVEDHNHARSRRASSIVENSARERTQLLLPHKRRRLVLQDGVRELIVVAKAMKPEIIRGIQTNIVQKIEDLLKETFIARTKRRN